MSNLSDAMAALQASLNALVPALSNSVNRKVANAAQADNANTLGNQTPAQLIATANSHTDAHAALTNNPHGTTAGQIGAYPSTTVDSLLAQYIPTGILPISMFGNINGDVVDYMTVSGSALNFTVAGIPLIMAGQFFAFGILSTPLTKGAVNKIYIQLISGSPVVVVSATAIPESMTNMYIGSVTLDASGNVTANSIAHVVRVDNYRISTTGVGGAIPVSAGTPDATAHLLWT